MLNQLLKLISFFKVNLPQKPNTQITRIQIPANRSDAIQLFKDIAALNLMLTTLNNQAIYYKEHYAKKTKELAYNSKRTLKQTIDLHNTVNTYHNNIVILEREIKDLDQLLASHTTKVFKDYLNLDIQYDNN